MNSLVSIIVPIYNVEKYLDRCIESIVSQTYRDLEIILVDDGSPDSCPQMCDRWAEKDDRIKVIHKENAGVGFARNSGLDIATGDYISFVDPDDYLSLDAVEIMTGRIVKDQSDLVVAQCVKVYSDGSQALSTYHWITDGILTQDEAFKMVGSSHELPVYIWGKLYHRQIFNKIRFQSLTCAEDVYILPDILEQCKTISFVGVVEYFYFQRESSIVHSKKRSQIVDSIVASLRLARFLLNRKYFSGASRYYYSAICQYMEIKNDDAAKKIIKEAFTREEKRMLKKIRDKRTMLNLLSARFPSVYNFYKTHIKNKHNNEKNNHM